MPQIAQQDYIVIEPVYDGGNLTEQSKEQIRDLVKRGVIFDCLFLLSDALNRVLSVDEGAGVVYVFDSASESFAALNFGD